MSRVHVLGGGAIGCFIAHELRQSGHAVSLLVRNPTEARGSLKVDYGYASRSSESEVDLEKSSGDGSPIQALVSTAKAFDVPSALLELRPRLTKDTGVVIVHNGLMTERVDELLPGVDPQNVFDGTTLHAVHQFSRPPAAHVAAANKGYLKMGLFDRAQEGKVASANAQALIKALVDSKSLFAELLDFKAFYRASRVKLGINAPYNFSTAIMNATNGETVAPDSYKRMSRMITDEVAAVYEAERVAEGLGEPDPALSADALWHANSRSMAESGTSFSSTLQDLRNGKKTEIAYINGSICELGKRYGVPTPCNEFARRLMDLRSDLGNKSLRF